MEYRSEIARLFSQLSEPFTAEPIFDCLTDIVFFVKDAEGAYLCVNQTLVERCGKKHKAELLGKRPSEVLGEKLGRGYEAQDMQVLSSGRSLEEQLELHVYPTQAVGWCMTSKLPLLDASGVAIGVVGVSRDLQMPDVSSDDFRRISAAVDYAEGHLASNPGNLELASIAGMTAYQLDRRMKRVFGMTTGQWLLKTRIGAASELLAKTRVPIADVAFSAGYTDQSAFTRQFKRATGLTPSAFRRLKQ